MDKIELPLTDEFFRGMLVDEIIQLRAELFVLRTYIVDEFEKGDPDSVKRIQDQFAQKINEARAQIIASAMSRNM